MNWGTVKPNMQGEPHRYRCRLNHIFLGRFPKFLNMWIAQSDCHHQVVISLNDLYSNVLVMDNDLGLPCQVWRQAIVNLKIKTSILLFFLATNSWCSSLKEGMFPTVLQFQRNILGTYARTDWTRIPRQRN